MNLDPMPWLVVLARTVQSFESRNAARQLRPNLFLGAANTQLDLPSILRTREEVEKAAFEVQLLRCGERPRHRTRRSDPIDPERAFLLSVGVERDQIPAPRVRDQAIGMDRSSRGDALAALIADVEDVPTVHGLRQSQHDGRIRGISSMCGCRRHSAEQGIDPSRILCRQRSFDLGQRRLRRDFRPG